MTEQLILKNNKKKGDATIKLIFSVIFVYYIEKNILTLINNIGKLFDAHYIHAEQSMYEY